MKKRRKPYRPRPVRAPAIIGTHTVFAAPMALLHQIRHSEVWTVDNEVVMPKLDESEIFSAPEVFRLFAHVILEIGDLHGLIINTTPLLMLANRLEADMPIDDGALRPVEEIFELGQRLANRITPQQAIEIIEGHRSKRVSELLANRSPDRPGAHEAGRPHLHQPR